MAVFKEKEVKGKKYYQVGDSLFTQHEYNLAHERYEDLIVNKDLKVDIDSESYRKLVMFMARSHNEGIDLSGKWAHFIRMNHLEFHFSHPFELHYWLDEALGQISDGKYENNQAMQQHRFYNFFYVLPVFLDSETKITGNNLPFEAEYVTLRFTDLIWLFDSTERPKMDNVRWVGSQVIQQTGSAHRVKEYLKNIQRAWLIKKKRCFPNLR